MATNYEDETTVLEPIAARMPPRLTATEQMELNPNKVHSDE